MDAMSQNSPVERTKAAAALASSLSGSSLTVASRSAVEANGVTWFFGWTPGGARWMAVPAGGSMAALGAFEGERVERAGIACLMGPITARNAAALRDALPWLRPRPVGLGTSAGFGDRLGLATPGHALALRDVGGAITPIFAQQSIREMTRTGRTPQAIIDDATWGAFEAGWTGGVGADADHIKQPADADACAAAGFSWFTVDPGAHVDDGAEAATPAELEAAWQALPWPRLEDTPGSLRARYAGRTFDIESHPIRFEDQTVVRAAVKYGRAIAHVAEMFRHIRTTMRGRAFSLEVSVDETESPTTHADHVFVVTELRRLGVEWVSLAPRFIGRFEKGVEYIGDLAAFEANFAVHAAIARVLGPYKISLHSGSDKFAIYGIAARQTRGNVHLKTAGTSYLEALRAVAEVDPGLFREIYRFSRERYGEDRASYHVSASVDRAPEPWSVPDQGVGALLDHFDVRQILHVTFGSVLTTRGPDGNLVFADAIMALLRSHRDIYAGCLERHFVRHLRPFVNP